MKRIYFYYEDGIINDATSFYVDIIESAAKESGFALVRYQDLNHVLTNDVILTIWSKNFLEAKFRHPFKKTIFWSQGVEPEETSLYRGKIIYYIKSMMEYLCLRCSDLLFLVSKEMWRHYKNKYRLELKNTIIMPCFNADVLNVGNPDKYNQPSFVFAGGASSWHCAEEIVHTFKIIEDNIPSASITILSNAKEQYERLFRKYNVQNYKIDYIPLAELQGYLFQFKYGFLLREKHVINSVATPTKMSSYLGAGIIPIFTTAIADFKDNIDLGEFSLIYDTPIDVEEIAKSIISFEKKTHDYKYLLHKINKIFNGYYSRDRYVSIIALQLRSLFK